MNTFQKSTATIAAWNLEGYGGIPAERVAKQVEGLAYLDAEVVALVEISPISVIDDIIAGLATCGLTYYKKIIPQNRDLHIGLLYKDGVDVTNEQLLSNTDLGNNDYRKAFHATVKIWNFDFEIIVVHLKSGRNKPQQDIRDEQANEVFKHIQSIRAGSQEDIIVTGDFNMIPGQDISNFHHLGGPDVMDFLSSWDLQERFSHILPKGRANLLDGFAMTRTFSQEYIRGSLRLFPMHWTMNIGREEFKNTVSDHLPFVASFKIDRSIGG